MPVAVDGPHASQKELRLCILPRRGGTVDRSALLGPMDEQLLGNYSDPLSFLGFVSGRKYLYTRSPSSANAKLPADN
jgi:hypothetical protein